MGGLGKVCVNWTWKGLRSAVDDYVTMFVDCTSHVCQEEDMLALAFVREENQGRRVLACGVHGGMAAVMCCHPGRGEMDTLNWKERARLCVVIVCRDSLSNESQLPVPSRTGKHGPARVNAFPTPAPVLFLPTTRQYYLLSSRASPSLSLSLTLSPSSLSLPSSPHFPHN